MALTVLSKSELGNSPDTVSQHVRAKLWAPIAADRYCSYFSLLSVCYVVFWRSVGYARMGKNHSHSIVPGGFEVMS
jgi:hypothetical protein